MCTKKAIEFAVCSEAFWLVLQSLFERAPKGFRSCSERLRSKTLSEYLLTGYEDLLSRSNVSIQTI